MTDRHSGTDWVSSTAPPPPSPDEVHVWRVRADVAAGDVTRWQAALSADEAERAAQFRLEPHRHRYLAARGVLRALLAQYMNTAPGDIEFLYAEHGKPHLAPHLIPGRAAGLDFNLSHSGDVILLAMAWGRHVGVDVERTGRDVGWKQVSRRFFAPPECEALNALPAAQQREGFFNCWTRKEAYLKARGRGLSAGLSTFAVSLDPGRPAALMWSAEAAEGPDAWHLEALEPAAGYTGAVCARGHDWRPRLLDFCG